MAIKVLHTITNLGVGGTETVVCDILRRLDREKFEPMLCVLGRERPDGMAEVLRQDGIPVYHLDTLTPYAIWKLARLYRRLRPDIVHTHLYRADQYGRIAARLAGIEPCITTLHNVDPERAGWRWSNIIDRVSLRWCHGLIAVSLPVKEHCIKNSNIPPERIWINPNGVDCSRFSEIRKGTTEYIIEFRKELGIPHGCPILGLVANFTVQKGHPYLIRAVGHLRKDFPNLRLLLIGHGSEEENLRNLVNNLGLKEQVIFLGKRRDIPEILAAIDIFVFPSLWEGLPVALLEAAAAGVPIVATDIPMNRQVLSSQHAWLVRPQHVNALALAIAEAVRNPVESRNKAIAAQEHVRINFSIDQSVSRLESYYLSLMNWK
ncbi:MAG: glycosyltransferase [Firmicutes bacterium]|nr:glycosyltransferase [Bacillota bacterium]